MNILGRRSKSKKPKKKGRKAPEKEDDDLEAEERDPLEDQYGELISDLCQSMIWEASAARGAYEDVLKRLTNSAYSNGFQKYHRAWVLQITYQTLRQHCDRFGSKVSPLEQVDPNEEKKDPVLYFDRYFHRLRVEDQILLLLMEKHHFPHEEIAAALNLPENSIKLKRQQALRTLEEWMWDLPDSPISEDFEWQYKLSDILDDNLTGRHKNRAEEFINSHPDFKKRLVNYKKIISILNDKPRFNFSEKKTESTLEQPKKKTRWEKVPWFIRSSAEGIFISLVVLVIVLMVPKLRTLYEKNLEKRLNDYDLAELVIKPEEESGEIGEDEIFEEESPDAVAAAEDCAEGENCSIPEEALQEEKKPEKIRVGNSEIWRFIIKTDSPKEIRPRIVQALVDLEIPKNTEGLQGVEAPGGIQFDLMVPKTVIPILKETFQEMAQPSSGGTVIKDNFTWFKIKSRKRIPKGQSRVVIWLSQI